MSLINGNKVYLVALGMVTYAILGVALGLHDVQRGMDLVLAALVAGGFRSAISKLERK